MSMKVIRQQLRQVSPQLYKQLHSLNFRDSGTMQGSLEAHRKKKMGMVHYILDGTKLVGWSLLFYDIYSHTRTYMNPNTPKEYWCHFYVRKSERRKGYGAQLFSANMKYSKRLKGKTFRVSKNDDNRGFFRKVKKKVKIVEGKPYAKV